MWIPFLFELRTVIDWMFTDTSLLFTEWVRIESIYAQVFGIKCKRLRNQHEFQRGVKRSCLIKYFIGGAVTIFLLVLLWFPLILFAVSPSLGHPNIPQKFTVTLQIGDFEPLFRVEANKANIHQFDDNVWKSLLNVYRKSPSASGFLKDYVAADVVAVNLNINSSSLWSATPPNIEKMTEALNKGFLKAAEFKYKIFRPIGQSNEPDTIYSSTEVLLEDTVCKRLATMLSNVDGEVIIPFLFPKLINLQNSGHIRELPELFNDCNMRLCYPY